jgi:hypothetical protein
MSDPNLWVNRDGNVVHPSAPLGGGGTGYFKSATPSGSGANLVPDVPEPFSPVGRNVVLTDKQKQQMLDAGAEPTPMQNPPAMGKDITVTNFWTSPDGKKDRTTVGIGEECDLTVSDVAGGKWESADGTGKTVNSVNFRWTATTAGTNTITYTAADKSTSSVTMTTVAPNKLSGKKVKDIPFPPGVQGAGMKLTVTVLPTTVSFQSLELKEGTVKASAISDYFTSHTPPDHDQDHGAERWLSIGPKNDWGDTAESSENPRPWSQGSYTWAIPVVWRRKGDITETAFSATSDQVITITGTDGTTIVTKLGIKSKPRKP